MLETKANLLNKILAFLLCVLPIIDPYLLLPGDWMMVEFIAICLVACAIIRNRVVLHKNFAFLLMGFFLLAILSACISGFRKVNFVLQLKVLAFQLINLVAFGYLWATIKKENFLQIIVAVGVVGAVLAIIQFVAVTLGYTNVYDGKLPFLVGENNHFGGLLDRNTGDVRVHSFFEEPSYMAVFNLPITAYCIHSKKIKSAIILAISCVLSGSLLGMFGLVIVLFYMFFVDSSINPKQKLQAFVVIMLAVVAGVIWYNNSQSLQELFDYYWRRLITMDQELQRKGSSVSLRLLGNIGLFEEYGLTNKLFGVGFNQYAVYFNLKKNYSNDFVSVLLDFGVFGFVAMVATLITLFLKTHKEGRVYFLIFVIAMAIGHIWFNTYFFYLLTWCVYHAKKNDVIKIKTREAY